MCEKLAHIIQHGILGVYSLNTEGASTEANDVSHIF